MAVSNDGITLTVDQPTAGGVTVATWSVTGRTDIKRWEISRDGIDADAIGPLSSALLAAETLSFEFNLQPETAYTFSLVGFTLAGATDPAVTATYYTDPASSGPPPDPEPSHGSTPHAGNLAEDSVPDASLSSWGTLDGATDDGTYVAVTDHDHATGALQATANAAEVWVYGPQCPVTPGATMTFAVDVLVTGTGHTGCLNIEWYNSSGAWIADLDAPTVPLVAGEWTRVPHTIVVPSGAASAHINPKAQVTSGDVVKFTLADYYVGVDDVDPGDPPPTGDGTQRAVAGGWGSVTWGDEFNYGTTSSPVALNAAKWSPYDGPGHDGNGVRSPAAFTVNGDYARCHGNPTGTTGGAAYETYSSVYHRVEVRARMAADGSGSGEQYHPVLIMWPDSDEWPQGGEYDFAESDIGDTQMGAFMHWPSDDSGDQTEFNSGTMDLTQWHNYAFECSSTGLRAWIDGAPFFTLTNPAAFPPPGPMHFTFQLDNFGGTSHKGANLDVMWVRGYAAPS